MAEEQLKVTEAWEYFRNKTGIEIERRAFFSWVETGSVMINGQTYELASNQIGKTHFISRTSIDRLIAALKS
jgi:hypothetical protein